MPTVASALLAFLLTADAPHAGKYFQIQVVDEDTGRGVPLVELKTVNAVRYYTDSNGIVAFYEPGLMDREVFFAVSSHGYEFAKDGFGMHGRIVRVTEGGSTTLKIKRLNVAQRLYRLTGAGVYRDSLLTGHAVPIRQPLLNGLVVGQDSVLTTVHGGKVYWFWGDTSRARYPLGNFHASGATSRLPDDGGLDPNVGVDLEYFVDEKGFSKEMAKMPGQGPTWLDGLVVLEDRDGHKRMLAKYVKVAKPMRVYERGLVEYDDRKEQFAKLFEIDMQAPLFPSGHPVKHVADGVQRIYFPLLTRVRATVEDYRDLSKYETYTCLKQGSTSAKGDLDRDAEGRLRYAWKAGTAPLTHNLESKLIADGRMTTEEAWHRLVNVETGKPVILHRCSVYFNAFRQRFVMVFCETFGTSLLGEIWYAEADTPIGPWAYARKIVTHQKYSLYNPKRHPMFDKNGGREIFFEGTYTHTFSGNPDRTPRYDYNQIMYKLDLADARLVLPVPVYGPDEGGEPSVYETSPAAHEIRPGRKIAFYALDRPRAGAVPVYCRKTVAGPVLSTQGDVGPAFYALTAEGDDAAELAAPLYEFVHKNDRGRTYSLDAELNVPGYRRNSAPVCRVWTNPKAADRMPDLN